ncbi:UNVERIFIED_CONTAM: signal transduction histidine kinase [Brevibacillus sp. OAP136]
MSHKQRLFTGTLVQQVRSSIRIQLIFAFACCVLVSVIVGFVTRPLFVTNERRLDFMEGIVSINESARELVKQFNDMNQDRNGLIIELGDKDPVFKSRFLNRSLPSKTGDEEWLTVPRDGNSQYRLTKSELILYLLNAPKQTPPLHAFITDAEGNIRYKSAGVNETHVDLPHMMEDAQRPPDGHDKHPIVTRLYPLTLDGAKAYLLVQGVPQSTVVYVKEPGWAPFLLGLITFFLCFYLITKRKMREMEEIAYGVKEIEKGNLQFRIQEKSKDELGSLAISINRMASELDQMIERERQAEKVKDELITNVSHDLRTPLTSIMGYMRLVKDRQYKNQAQLEEYVDIAYGKSEQLKKLIEDLFDFTRLHHEGDSLKKEKVSLNQMLRQLLEELDPIAKDNNVTFQKDFPSEPIKVEVDPNLMVRAFENVLTNAIKYSTHPGKILVKLVRHSDSVQMTVSNPCEALSKEEVHRLFDRFYRVDTSRTSSKSGAGLGLAITKSIVDLHQGSIVVEYEDHVIRLSIFLPL